MLCSEHEVLPRPHNPVLVPPTPYWEDLSGTCWYEKLYAKIDAPKIEKGRREALPRSPNGARMYTQMVLGTYLFAV